MDSLCHYALPYANGPRATALLCVHILCGHRSDPVVRNGMRMISLALRPEPPFTGVSEPSGPEISQKSLKKGLFGGSGEKSQKIPEKSKNTNFRAFWGIFSVFLDFSGIFWDFSPDPPKKTLFETFLRYFGPGLSGDSCKWRLGSQLSLSLSLLSSAPGLVRALQTQYENPMGWSQVRRTADFLESLQIELRDGIARFPGLERTFLIFFFCSGEGRGSPGWQGGGMVGFLIENPSRVGGGRRVKQVQCGKLAF